jgi:drug/metabolite transporter (DMT)-like permease
LAFWLYLRGLSRVAASVAGAFLNLIPVFGIGAAFVFLGEELNDAQWIGAVMILTSVFVLFPKRDRPVPFLE